MTDKTLRKPVLTWRVVRTFVAQAVVGAFLLAAVYVAMIVLLTYGTYQREQWIAMEIRALGGNVDIRYCGPNWIPYSLRARLGELPFRYRVFSVSLCEKPVTLETLRQLGRLTCIYKLDLRSTEITDADLKHLKRLSTLRELFLRHTKITDAGLEYLKEIRSLQRVHVRNTEVTAEGREMLRKALPNCRVMPEE